MNSCISLCRSFRDEARVVNRDLEDAFRLNMPRNEETITESLLLNLARNNPRHELQITSFNRQAEGINGADWEFWFSNASGYGIAVRVQAKRLFPSGKYESLFHQSKTQKDKSTNQCNELIHNAGTSIPIYVFYNSVSAFANLNYVQTHIHWGLSRLLALAHWQLSDWGITMCSAYSVQSANYGKNNSLKGFQTIPWHNLVCHKCWQNKPKDDDLPSMVGNSLSEMFSFDVDSIPSKERSPHNFEPSQTSPEWVSTLKEDASQENEKLIQHMKETNLRGVAIIRQPNFDKEVD